MNSLRLVLLFSIVVFQVSGQEPPYSNNFFSFHFNVQNNSICITSRGNDTLVSQSSFLQELIDIRTGDTVRMNASASSVILRTENGRPVYTWIDSTPYCITVFHAAFDSIQEAIKIDVEATYKKDVQVIRDAMILKMSQPLKEVYRRNTIVDTAYFQSEYWLNKAGARFGTGKNTLLIYHTPGISSLQLNAAENMLVINFDYANDHPFQHFPLLDSMKYKTEDYSCSIFKAGEARKNSFTIHAGKEIDFVPRLMLNPNGFLSGHIFTEHADWTDLPTHKAVYFGSEIISKAKKANGGFIKNKIPVTKSVFYSNPDSVLNSESNHKSIFTTPIASIKESPDFFEFLKQLKKSKIEICLHTPDHFTSARQLIDEACAFMQENFQTVTWIDHGYNNGPKNNREAFVCDGLNAASPSYAKDIWEKYGLKYFWNSYYEDFKTSDSMFFDFSGSPMHPYPGFGDAAPQPLYWRHPSRTGNFISWGTRDLLEMHDPASWEYHYGSRKLNDFVYQRAIKFEHCYPAGSIEDRGFWKKNEKNILVVEPEFNKVLQRLSAYADSGWINNTTVKSLLDYWVAQENISFDYTDSNVVKITNRNTSEIKGVSFAVNARKIISQKKMNQKIFDGDLIFWFDMKAGESVSVTFK